MKKNEALKNAIYKTLIYSDLFGSALSKEDLHRFLYKCKINKKNLYSILPYLPFISIAKNVIVLKGREELLKHYKTRLRESDTKLKSVQNILSILSKIPSIQLISVSGSVAAKNATKAADIDLFIITKDHTLWISRVIVTCILFIFSKKRKVGVNLAPGTICTNMWMSESRCTLTEKNIFVAREVIQMRVLYDKNTMHSRFLQKNKWVYSYFPNMQYTVPFTINRTFSVFMMVYMLVNYLLFVLQYLYMKNKITKEIVTLHTVAFHPKDISSAVLSTYNNRLKTYQYLIKNSFTSANNMEHITPGS
jgi:hypothetical protein